MLDKPDFEDEKIIACLQAEYGLRIVQVAFLPLGSESRSRSHQSKHNKDVRRSEEWLSFSKLWKIKRP